MAKNDKLKIKRANTHNLKNISLDIPKNKLVVFTGVSGSGKSSLVFDTIYSEGQRRYVESLSSYARQFLGVMDKPDVESIEGISPAIAIDQKNTSKNPRSTVGTITEIYDYLRLLYAHVGKPYCPNDDILIEASSAQEITGSIKKLKGEVTILAPLISGKKGEHKGILQEVENAGFVRARIDGIIMTLSEALGKELDPKKKHNIEVIVDKMDIGKDLDKIRLIDSVETALKLGKGLLMVLHKGKEHTFSEKFACPKCGFSMREIEPRTFSFNSPYGACSECSGLGTKMEVDPEYVMPNKNLTLEEGAVQPWMTASHRVGRQGWYWMILQRMANKYDFDMDIPVKDLPKKAVDIILYGDDDLEGVIPNLERRHKETDSEHTRAEIEKYMNIRECPTCKGKRLRKEALAVKIMSKDIHDIVVMDIVSAHKFFEELVENKNFNTSDKKIAAPIVKEVVNRLGFLNKVGLTYLTLSRQAGTLSGGEAQRIQLATQLGSHLSGVLYILDEPSIGLHARDQARLIETMKELRDLGSSVLVVEHDPLTINEADYIVDIGPGAGKHGGEVIFKGTPAQLKKAKTLTAKYMRGEKKVEGKVKNKAKEPKLKKEKGKQKYLTVNGVKHNNLKDIEVKVPLGKLVAVTGVSGSGKSSLVNDVLAKALRRELHDAHTMPGEYKQLKGLSYIDKAIVIDQSPIGRTPRSNPATYTNVFTPIRDLFAKTPEAKARGYKPGRFSFNVKGGRCERCRGGGENKVEMFFMSDIYVECEVCEGKRYNKDVLEIKYKGKDIHDILEMTVEDALEFFKNIPKIKKKLQVLDQVGLGYMQLGQPAPSLSGGEAQRVKLATELSRKSTGKTLHILDEPTTGLHADDVNNLLSVLKELVQAGNTVLVIEHNLDIIKNADHIIDLGPEGGDEGGEVIAQGSPKEISKVNKSYTGQYLRGLI
ncbi:MAG: excinuclease ABC subunit UvrA [Candidatus Spechtbacterales bacterium]|nr:excinuclease ABC subunit UvrA [Candidatus Spechtbacterales bacterium]